MLVQLVLLVKGLPAVGAEKVLYPRVDPPQVAVEVPLLEEGRLAHGALERPQVVVVDHVVLELGRGEEVLVADITVVRLVAALLAPGVLALLVLLEVDQLVEALLADVALERRLPGVGVHVAGEELLLEEAAVAHVALEAPLADVEAEVPLELVLLLEALAAVVAGKLPDPGLVALEVALQLVFRLQGRRALGAGEVILLLRLPFTLLVGLRVRRRPRRGLEAVHFGLVGGEHVGSAEELITDLAVELFAGVRREVALQSTPVLERLGAVRTVVELRHRITGEGLRVALEVARGHWLGLTLTLEDDLLGGDKVALGGAEEDVLVETTQALVVAVEVKHAGQLLLLGPSQGQARGQGHVLLALGNRRGVAAADLYGEEVVGEVTLVEAGGHKVEVGHDPLHLGVRGQMTLAGYFPQRAQ